MIPLHEPFIGDEEAQAAAECIRSGWVSSAGPQVTKFEQEFSELVGQPAAAVSSGTAALHLALLLAGVGPGDKVLVPAMTFVATANAVTYCGAKPMFIDVRSTGHMDSVCLRDWLASHDTKSVKAVIVTHLFGTPASSHTIRTHLQDYGIQLIEDAAQSVGAHLRDAYSDLRCFSFNGNKTVTCGGGGMLTGKQQLVDQAKYLSAQAVDDPIRFDHGEVGFNYRMTAVAAAIGSVQLAKLKHMRLLKSAVYDRYDVAFELLRTTGALVPWVYRLKVHDAEQAVLNLRANGIGARRVWMPLPLTRVYGTSSNPCSVAEAVYQHTVLLPSSPGLSPEDQDKVIKVVREKVL